MSFEGANPYNFQGRRDRCQVAGYLYCTVSTIVLLVTMVLVCVLVMVAVMFVVPAATLVASPLPLPLRPLLIVATLVLDEVQVTA